MPTLYSVELRMPAVPDGQFEPLRAALDLMPNAALLEDPVAPTIVVPVEAPTPARAHLFAEAVLAIAGMAADAVTVSEIQDDDIDYAALGITDDDADTAADLPPEIRKLQQWVQSLPAAV